MDSFSDKTLKSILLYPGILHASILELLIKSKVKRHLSLFCHSGLSGIFLCFQKDSRRASLAGMTTCEALLMTSLVKALLMSYMPDKQQGGCYVN